MNCPEQIIKKKTTTPQGVQAGILGFQKKSVKCHGLPRKSIIFFKPPSHPVVVSFRAQNFQKSRNFHDLSIKCFHFKPYPHPPGKASFREHREGGKEEEGRRKRAGREEGGRKKEGGW